MASAALSISLIALTAASWLTGCDRSSTRASSPKVETAPTAVDPSNQAAPPPSAEPTAAAPVTATLSPSVPASTAPTSATPAAAALTEPQKIDQLIAVLEKSDAKFIRSGTSYDGKRAADHLRTKLKSAGDRKLTARDFIEHIASKSSLSGRDYQVQDAGVTTTARAWFTKQLEAIEATAK